MYARVMEITETMTRHHAGASPKRFLRNVEKRSRPKIEGRDYVRPITALISKAFERRAPER